MAKFTLFFPSEPTEKSHNFSPRQTDKFHNFFPLTVWRISIYFLVADWRTSWFFLTREWRNSWFFSLRPIYNFCDSLSMSHAWLMNFTILPPTDWRNCNQKTYFTIFQKGKELKGRVKKTFRGPHCTLPNWPTVSTKQK